MNKLPTLPIGAIELIRECQELLAGKRQRLTPVAEYMAQRRHYWQMQSNRPPRRSRAGLPRRAA
ncbi:MAG TPA: hypothetical protein VMW62_03905 [Chloroflexota bacterium]|nr:hypothetical protein [Chloroflexota bacterium]